MQLNARDPHSLADRLHGVADGVWIIRRRGHSLGNERLEDLADLLDTIADAIDNGVDYRNPAGAGVRLDRALRQLTKDLKDVTLDPEEHRATP